MTTNNLTTIDRDAIIRELKEDQLRKLDSRIAEIENQQQRFKEEAQQHLAVFSGALQEAQHSRDELYAELHPEVINDEAEPTPTA